MRLPRPLTALTAALVLVAGVTACADDSNTTAAPAADLTFGEQNGRAPEAQPGRADPGNHPSDGPHGRVAPQHEEQTAVVPASSDVAGGEASLTDDDVAGLLWMREEEQLAHDVYVELGEHWGLRIFENIAASERSHVEGVVDLLDRSGIDDPLAESGTFTIPEMQELFDRLVADGMESLEDALRVGAFIEELDIVDLRELAADTEVAEIDALYQWLEKGSRNHLRAFTSQLERRDEAYAPTQLDQAEFDEIISAPMERGHEAADQ